MSTLDDYDFATARVSASGQRKGERRNERTIPGDIIAVALCDGVPHLQVEVGGVGKRLRAAFAELRSLPLPGFAQLVVRFVNRKRWYYTSPDDRFEYFGDALQHLKRI